MKLVDGDKDSFFFSSMLYITRRKFEIVNTFLSFLFF